MNTLDSWYLENLVCPKDKTKLSQHSNLLISESGNKYPIVNGIPIMLLDDVQQTIELANMSMVSPSQSQDDYFINTLGIPDKEKDDLKKYIEQKKSNLESFDVDPVVQFLIVATNGNLYIDSKGNLNRYPIPNLRLPDGGGKNLLDIGCSWGRWCIAGAYKNYNCVGIDPSLGAVLAGRRIAEKLGLDIKFVVGDARYLPLKESSFDQVFSYSVLQHFSKSNVRPVLKEIHWLLKPQGKSFIQMPNRFGIRSLQQQIKASFKEEEIFDVRYWGLKELYECFTQEIGESKISIDGFFGLNIQKSDVDLLPIKYRLVVELSEILRKIGSVIPFLKLFADSVYVESIRSF
jgi:2-polyprenyl-3-methyl-5-hydroxy-6-metoxy-1,4-benzoquinol methylase/uncharacterized protein YbaR (Trm112 family)